MHCSHVASSRRSDFNYCIIRRCLHLFDPLYHATAMHTEDATLITADDSCYDKA